MIPDHHLFDYLFIIYEIKSADDNGTIFDFDSIHYFEY